MIVGHLGQLRTGEQSAARTDPEDYDPVVAAIRRLYPLSPFRFSLIFAVAAFTTSCTVAALEGRLFSSEPGILPLWRNISTLLDFLLLNPLGLYCILRSYRALTASVSIRPASKSTSILAGIIAIGSMA